MIRLVVFDFDGTLVDSNGVKEACLVATAATVAGGEVLLPLARGRGGNRYRVFAELARRVNPNADDAMIAAQGRELAAAYTRCCLKGIMAAPERRGARAALRVLKRRRTRIWINSATPTRDLPVLLRARGLLAFLDGALGGPGSKAENLLKSLVAESVSPRETLMVGDGPDDFAAAREVGTWFIAVSSQARITEPCSHRMRDLTPLVPWIDRLCRRPIDAR
jgi:phosphoglycolate phosphatase